MVAYSHYYKMMKSIDGGMLANAIISFVGISGGSSKQNSPTAEWVLSLGMQRKLLITIGYRHINLLAVSYYIMILIQKNVLKFLDVLNHQGNGGIGVSSLKLCNVH